MSLLLQVYSRQPDEPCHHAVCGELWSSHRTQEPVAQLPASPSEHARLQLGHHGNHRPGHDAATGDPGRAAQAGGKRL